MSAPQPYEQALLAPANAVLHESCAKFSAADRFEARLQLLEAAASRLGAFSTREYFAKFGIEGLFSWRDLETLSALLIVQFQGLPMHPSLALSSLAREPMASSVQRKAGSYYTDFRLAGLVAQLADSVRAPGRPAIDPACGAGILLCALTFQVCGHDRRKAASWLANYVHAADASVLALRGALLSLASFTDDIEALVSMRRNWYCGDTLLRPAAEWSEAAPQGYGIVTANPPWEKVKSTRHEFAKENGVARHYGANHGSTELSGFESARNETANYARKLAKRYPLIAGGEVDLYSAFTELFLRLARNGGGISALLPGGLIRSQSTEQLRHSLINGCRTLNIGILDNRARYFGIDTRFKFLAVAGRTVGEAAKQSTMLTSIGLGFYSGEPDRCVQTSTAKLSLRTLRALRPDLSLPEVRNQREWTIFVNACRAGTPWREDEGQWSVHFSREVDMTKDRPNFKKSGKTGALAVVEGRMVHHHRFGAKTYVSGSGRAAMWSMRPIGHSRVRPQFWIDPVDLTPEVRARAERSRAGFCDIAGQTNERSMMSAVIPSGHVCGNKVPTIEFVGGMTDSDMWLWVGLTNSLPFDWMLRRVLTTSVNYFLLRSVPLPSVTSDSLPGRRIVAAAKELSTLDTAGASRATSLRAAELRAQIDVIALAGYGLKEADIGVMLEDFPLLDRGQPAIRGELRSTVTADFVTQAAARHFRRTDPELASRVQEAINSGATPYIPAMSADDPQGELTLNAAS